MTSYNKEYTNYDKNHSGFQFTGYQHVPFLESISLTDLVSHNNIAWQLIKRCEYTSIRYISLAHALKSKKIIIKEVSKDGSIPVLECKNMSGDHILILAGEEITGAKQNRIINISIIVPPQSNVLLPVSCVEQGRWGYDSPDFSKGYSAYTDLKRVVMEDVVMSAARGRGYESNQGRVWDDIREKEMLFNKHSRTGAMHELYDDTQYKFDNFLRGIDISGTCGVCMYINGSAAGLDIFPDDKYFQDVYSDIFRSYFLEAERCKTSNEPYSTFEKGESLIKYLTKVASHKTKGVSKGDNYNIISNYIVSTMISDEDEIVHLTAHPRRRGSD